MLYNILLAYLAGLAFTAISLTYHIFIRFDQYDRKYREMKWDFALTCILWPIFMIFSPLRLFNPGCDFGTGEHWAEEARLQENPPPVGDIVLYQAKKGGYSDTFGEFTFNRQDILDYLQDRWWDESNDYPLTQVEYTIHHWLDHHYDRSISQPTVVPTAWNRFQFIADDMIRQGIGKVHCTQCQLDYNTKQLLSKNDRGHAGWNSNRLHCPKNHPLFVVQTTHYTLAS